MRVLVTGSAGFIGRWVVQKLIERGDQVSELDMLNVPAARGVAEHHVCDIRDGAQLANIVRRFAPNAVVHLAARTDLNEKTELSGYSSNIDGVANLVSAIEVTPSVKRAIWTSSQLVCKVGYVPKSPTDYLPSTLYGQSKVLTEKIVRDSDGAGRTWTIVRPTTVWGPGMSPHYRRFLNLIQKGRYFHVGKKPLLKSYSYVGNIAHQYLKLLDAPHDRIHSQTYYLADYEPIDLIEWSNAFQRELGSRAIPTIPLPAARLLAKAGDVINAAGVRRFPFNSFRLTNILTPYCFDTSPIKAVCGPLPFSVREGISETAKWVAQRRVID